MATLSKTPMPSLAKFNKSVSQTPDINGETAFDSTLDFGGTNANATLRITLRLFFKQINPYSVTAPMFRAIASALGIPVPAGVQVGSHPDYSNNSHFIKEWSSADWSNFINSVKAQASLWNGKFWLIPPDEFTFFDLPERSFTRPNVKCEFNFEVAMSPSYCHRSIDVVNLLRPSSFRSHDRLYDSEDAVPRPKSLPDARLRTVNTIQPVIAHELGHAIGLPHIGVSRNLAQCGLAVIWGKTFHQDSIPALWQGHTGSDACYGAAAGAGDINNIMGAGAQFSQENAKPWLDRLISHMNLSQHEYFSYASTLGKWKVSLSEVRPSKSLVTF